MNILPDLYNYNLYGHYLPQEWVMSIWQRHGNWLALPAGLSDTFILPLFFSPGVFSKLWFLIKFWDRPVLQLLKYTFEIALIVLCHSYILAHPFLHTDYSTLYLTPLCSQITITNNVAQQAKGCSSSQHMVTGYRHIQMQIKLNTSTDISHSGFWTRQH